MSLTEQISAPVSSNVFGVGEAKRAKPYNRSERREIKNKISINSRRLLHSVDSTHRTKRPGNARNQRSGAVREAAIEFQTRVSVPILDVGMNSTSALLLWSADTLAFTTVVIGLDSSNPGQPASTTRRRQPGPFLILGRLRSGDFFQTPQCRRGTCPRRVRLNSTNNRSLNGKPTARKKKSTSEN